MICRITKLIRLRGRISRNILLTAPVLKNLYGITKRGVLNNTVILLEILTNNLLGIYSTGTHQEQLNRVTTFLSKEYGPLIKYQHFTCSHADTAARPWLKWMWLVDRRPASISSSSRWTCSAVSSIWPILRMTLSYLVNRSKTITRTSAEQK